MPSIVNPNNEEEDKGQDSVVDDEMLVDDTEESDIDLSGADAQIIWPEDLPPETALFDGGPTAGEVVEWKQEYGHVYVTEISFDEYVIWRTIDRGEYRNLVRTINNIMESGKVSEVELNMYNEELICKMGILYPQLSDEDFDKQLAGMPSIISQQILEQSGFRPIDTRGL